MVVNFPNAAVYQIPFIASNTRLVWSRVPQFIVDSQAVNRNQISNDIVKASMSNPNGLQSQKLCHYLYQAAH